MTAPSRPLKLAFQPAFVILSGLLFFTVFWYFGRAAFFQTHLTDVFPPSALSSQYPFFYFCLMSVLFRMLLPMLCIRYVLKRRLGDFGFAVSQAGRGWKLYLGLYLAMVPLVVLAATTDSFLSFYPQFRGLYQRGPGGAELIWWHLLVFELVYGLLFISGESFWRGYLVFGLEEELGDYAILVMVIPYVMSHYEKPFLETLGAFVAGSVLGYLALRHRNFWLGVFVHWGVAITMDLAALWQSGVVIVY